MSLLRLIYPQTIKIPDSEFNKNIIVVDYLGSTALIVDGLIESGNIMTQVWRAGINRLIPKKFIPKNVLLLGLAGGSNARLINRRYPHAKITAVEIDPLMIELGNKYFALQKIRHMDIVVGDALHFANHMKPKDHFDLILVDCFIGKNIPKKLESLDFFQKLKAHSRYTLINRVAWYDHAAPTLAFMGSLATKFFFIKTHTYTNLIVSIL